MPVNYPLEVLEPGLEEQAFEDPVNFTFPSGGHVAEVEIDPETGRIALGNYVAVDDVGTVINPMIVQGQIHGGLVQGIGQALCETCVYDDVSGQLLPGSFMDYCMPARRRHSNNARRDTEHSMHPQSSWCERLRRTWHDRGPATVINAVVDALAHLGVTHVDMPASPSRMWQIINSGLVGFGGGAQSWTGLRGGSPDL